MRFKKINQTDHLLVSVNSFVSNLQTGLTINSKMGLLIFG